MWCDADASLADQRGVAWLPPVVIEEGGYEARRHSRKVQIAPEDPGKRLMEPDIVFESSDSEEDMRSRYERIGRNHARIMEQQCTCTSALLYLGHWSNGAAFWSLEQCFHFPAHRGRGVAPVDVPVMSMAGKLASLFIMPYPAVDICFLT